MTRAVYSHELIDPDFAWLIASFQEDNGHYVLVDAPGLPMVFIERPVMAEVGLLPLLPPAEGLAPSNATIDGGGEDGGEKVTSK